jgi:outer membrane protein OmpA-like peptidoglycan-associated protein/AmiR/NasT family two-component response regulator
VVDASDILGGKVLVVDDSQANVRLLERMLRGAGYTSVSSTTDPRLVCNLHAKNRYDLILLDLQMPGLDGFRVLEGLKQVEKDGYLSVLVMTAHPGNKQRAMEGGAKDFIGKPFNAIEVLTRVYNLLELRLLHLASKRKRQERNMKGVNYVIGAVTVAAVLASAAGCASWGDKQKKGTGIGAAGGGAIGALIGHHMDAQAEKLAQELQGAQVSRVGEGIAVTFDSGILFPYDSAELTSQARSNLAKLADSLQTEARTNVMIVGHTDSAGSDSYNQQLSEQRGRSAESYLASQGVSSSRLASRGRGEAEPIASNGTDDGRRQNRRVEVAIFANGTWRDEAKQTSTSSLR